VREIPRWSWNDLYYYSVDGERDPSLATFAKASVAEALGMTADLVVTGEEEEIRWCESPPLPLNN